ncbi:MAG: type II toxin-antitoxin system Phd/YefM family antitoxin [Kiritimatiellaeota bacterium]|nr:type II toxin-antitoxin system Phd/YefM family antitoxin [Kiritimatiellota bacterium]
MRFIPVRDFRTRPAQIWKDLPGNEEMVITNNGKPIAMLAPVSESNLEETLNAFRKVKAMNAVQKMQAISFENNNATMTLSEINEEIAAERKNRT